MSDGKLEETFAEAYSLLEDKNIGKHLYDGFEGISSLFLAWKQGRGEQGWSARLVDREGNDLFNEKKRREIEDVFLRFDPYLRDFFDMELQKGGGIDLGPGGSMVRRSQGISAEDISIDKLYQTITETMDSYDEQWRLIADSLGIVKAIEAQDYMGVLPGPLPIPYYILGKSILPTLNVFLDLLRLALGNPSFDSPNSRIILSVLLAFLEMLRGDWLKAVLSLGGVVNSSGVLIGFTAKIMRNAWLFVAPDLRKELRSSMYKSSKALCAGFMLWCFTIFAPQVLRVTIDASFAKIREIVQKFNQKLEDAEEKVTSVAEKSGVTVKFPRIPVALVPSMDDIQNLLVLARVPEIFCSEEIQKLLKPILMIPPLRLILELLNIPTLESDRAAICLGKNGSISETLVSLAAPTIEPISEAPLETTAKEETETEKDKEKEKDKEAEAEADADADAEKGKEKEKDKDKDKDKDKEKEKKKDTKKMKGGYRTRKEKRKSKRKTLRTKRRNE